MENVGFFNDTELKLLGRRETEEHSHLDRQGKDLECRTHHVRIGFALVRIDADKAKIVWYCHECEAENKPHIIHELIVDLPTPESSDEAHE